MDTDEILDKINTYRQLYLNECVYEVKRHLMDIVVYLLGLVPKFLKQEIEDGSDH